MIKTAQLPGQLGVGAEATFELIRAGTLTARRRLHWVTPLL